jgi:DNA methyltransferase 1-associated protein 1
LQFPGAPERSIEDLKARYYSVARQLLVGREGGPESVANHTLVGCLLQH